MSIRNIGLMLLSLGIGSFVTWYFWLREPPHAKKTSATISKIEKKVEDIDYKFEGISAYLGDLPETSNNNLRVPFEKGQNAMNEQKWDAAILYYKQALNYANGTEIVALFTLIGYCYYNSSRLDDAFSYYNDAVKLANQFNDYEGMANAYKCIGLLYQTKDDFKNSLRYFNDSKKLYEELNSKDGLATIMRLIGYLYYSKNKYNDALIVYEKLRIFAQQNEMKINEADALYSIGVLYHLKNKLDTALVCLNNALELYSQVNSKSAIAQTEDEIKKIQQKMHKN